MYFYATDNKKINLSLRPNSFKEFVGHEALVNKLSIFVYAAKERAEPPGHLLLYGPPGLGKTSIAHIIAKELGVELVSLSAPLIEKPSDIAGVLTKLETGGVLFIDEIHRINRKIEEYLYSAMEDFVLDILIDSGTQSRSVQVKLNKFCLIGATTSAGELSEPLRSRFELTCRIDYYEAEWITKVLRRAAKALNIPIDDRSLLAIAKRSRGTPRKAISLIKWIRDYSQVKDNSDRIHECTTIKALNILNIDELGLDETDKRILETIIDSHKGGPVGLGAIAASLGESATTLQEVNESFLIRNELIKRTRKGRIATRKAYEHLSRKHI